MRLLTRLYNRLRWLWAANQRRLDLACLFRMLAETADSVEGARASIVLHMHEDRAWTDWYDERAREELTGLYAQRMVSDGTYS